MLEKMINFVYGALIFLILVGIAFSVYHIFWAKNLTVPEQNFDSVFSELNALKKDSCFDVVVRPFNLPYTFLLYPWENNIAGCSGKPCFCLDETGNSVACKIIPDISKDCSKGPCGVESSTVVVSENNKLKICNSGNKLSIKLV